MFVFYTPFCKKGEMMQKRLIYMSLLTLVLFFSACGSGSGADTTQNTQESNTTTNENNSTTNENNATEEQSTTSGSTWSITSSIYNGELSKTVSIANTNCTLLQTSSGIGYNCNGLVNANKVFTYSEVAQVIAPSLVNVKSLNGEIYVAESNTTKEGIIGFWNHPLIFKNKMYSRYLDYYYGLATHYVNEYNLSAFTQDMTLESLESKKIYSHTQGEYYLFNTSFYNLMEENGFLYVPTLPLDEATSQSGIMKYSLERENITYEINNSPRLGKRQDITFDLTRGWMTPSNGKDIAFIDGFLMRRFDSCSGKEKTVEETRNHIRYIYSKLAGGSIEDSQIPPVSDEKRYFILHNQTFESMTFSSPTSYGYMDTTAPNHTTKTLLDDFIAKNGDAKSYRFAQSRSEMILEKGHIYFIAGIRYTASDTFDYEDVYIMQYSTAMELEATCLIGSDERVSELNVARQFYKLGSVLYFKMQKFSSTYLYAYDLDTKQVKFNYEINGTRLRSNLAADAMAITGNTIIVPQRVYAEDHPDDSYYYDLVFTVLDANDGHVIKQIKHSKFKNFAINDYISILSALIYGDSVYFTLKRSPHDNIDHSILVKIINPENKVQMTRYRGDNRFSGVLKTSLLELTSEPTSIRDKLIISLYEQLHDTDADLEDLNSSLLNYVASESLQTITKLLGVHTTPQEFGNEQNITVADVNETNSSSYAQSTPLYNTELYNANAQTFYVPLLTHVHYSSDSESGGFGEARIKVNAQYSCNKSYFRFPTYGSVKIEHDLLSTSNEGLGYDVEIPMLHVDYNYLQSYQLPLRYGIDAKEFDDLGWWETLKRRVKNNLKKLIDLGISIISGNYTQAACESANAIVSNAVSELNEGDTYYGSAMRIYTPNSNFGIEDNRSFREDTIKGSSGSVSLDAQATGNIIEGICSSTGVSATDIVSFATGLNANENWVKAKVKPTWHKGIVIKNMQVELEKIDILRSLPNYLNRSSNELVIKGKLGILGTQQIDELFSTYEEYTPTKQVEPFLISYDLKDKVKSNDLRNGYSFAPKMLHDANYTTASSGIIDSTSGIYLEMTLTSNNMQVGVFTDTLFLDEAIFTNEFTKSDKTYTKIIVKNFDLPAAYGTRPVNGYVTYKVSFSVE